MIDSEHARAAFSEFEEMLERARTDLVIAIEDVVSVRFIEGDEDVANDNSAVMYPWDDIYGAFREFDWLVARALSALKKAAKP